MSDRPHVFTVSGISNVRWYRHAVTGEVVLGMLAETETGDVAVVKIPHTTADALLAAVGQLPPPPVDRPTADQQLRLLHAVLETM